MLLLTRKVGEKIIIGDDVIITVKGFKGSKVILSVEAPKDLPVHREEVYLRIQADEAGEK